MSRKRRVVTGDEKMGRAIVMFGIVCVALVGGVVWLVYHLVTK